MLEVRHPQRDLDVDALEHRGGNAHLGTAEQGFSRSDRLLELALVDDLDEECTVRGLVMNEPKSGVDVSKIMNMSFGMLGINSALIVKAYK